MGKGLAVLRQSASASRRSVFTHGDLATVPARLRSRWHRAMSAGGEEYGVETLVVDDESRDEVEDYLDQHLNSTMEPDG